MACYNQLAFGGVPYPHPLRPRATVKTSGCGVCCISMLVEELTGVSFPPGDSARYSISVGARVSGGTDMARLGKAAASRFGLEYSATNDVKRLMAALADGARAIANVGGDRPGYKGLFSNGGHYVYVAGLEGGRLVVRDPGFYKGKLDTPARRGRAVLRGEDILTSPEALDRDCETRWPRYYVFKEENVTQAQFDRMMEDYLRRRAEVPADAYAAEAIAEARLAGISDGMRPAAFATRQEVVTMLMRAREAQQSAKA